MKNDNVLKAGLKQNPQNINRTGANRKSFATINIELEAKGIKPLSKHDLIDAYGRIFNSTEDELKELATDKNIPFAFRLLILQLNDKKVRDLALKDYRDYMFGKANQTINENVKLEHQLNQETIEFLKKLDAELKAGNV